jgi:DNA-binding FadR family transcriptional regulator
MAPGTAPERVGPSGARRRTASQPERRASHAPRAAYLVANELRRRIVVGELHEGDALPSERELTDEFGVSRPTVREALRTLEAQRLLTAHRRAGARVHLPDRGVAAQYAALLLQVQDTTLADVLAARQLFEVAVVRTAAANPSDAVLTELRATWAAERDILDQPFAVARSVFERFHRLVIGLAGSFTASLVSDMLAVIIDRNLHTRLSTRIQDPRYLDNNQRSHEDHGQMIECFEQRDVEEAAKLWQRHLETNAHIILKTHGASTVDLLS